MAKSFRSKLLASLAVASLFAATGPVLAAGSQKCSKSAEGVAASSAAGDVAQSTGQGSPYGDPLPSKLINGDSYPTAETTIDSWINVGGSPNDAAIASHGWGLWAALSATTNTPVPGFTGGRVYNTWLSPGQVSCLPPSGALTAEQMNGKDSVTFTAPKQFSRIPQSRPALEAMQATSPLEWISESVAYSSSTAEHVHRLQLLKISTLRGYQKPGRIAEIPVFPTNSMAVKPVFVPITTAELDSNGLFKMSAWPGTPSPAKTFPSTLWGQCVYVDPKNNGKGDGSVDPTCANPTPQTTYNVSDFISLTATKVIPIPLSNGVDNKLRTLRLQPGDLLLLVGMHVATRETTQWTWQTFWWSASPGAPNAPSSKAIADARPEGLDAPADHYAMATAYMMVMPAQPIGSGKGVGEPLAAYNPHLEAPFDPGTFNIKREIQTPSGPITTEYGVQSNCMTCHSMANYGGGSGLGYGSDFYIGRDDPAFIGSVQTDFLWSIPDNAKEKEKK